MLTVSARQLQREYKKVLKKANRSKEPIIVISNNKLQGAVIGLDQLEEIRLNAVVEEVLKDYREGRTKSISNLEELEADFEEMKKEAGLSK
jgi:PHD/YefM family antitoxin component YafN of YafNO toxin-antitoxin module